MRLDARKGDVGWHVFHVPRAQVVPDVLWVSDETHRWAQYRRTANGQLIVVSSFGSSLDYEVHQAKLIRIIPSKKLVLIDPIDDPGAEDDLNELELLEIDPTWGQVYVKDATKKATDHK